MKKKKKENLATKIADMIKNAFDKDIWQIYVEESYENTYNFHDRAARKVN